MSIVLDYDAIANEVRKPATVTVDYDAIAQQVRSVTSPTKPTPSKPAESIYEKTGAGKVIGAVAPLAPILEAIGKPAAWAKQKIQSTIPIPDELGTDPAKNPILYNLRAAFAEGGKQSRKIVSEASMVLDPKMWPFLVSGAAGAAVRPVIRIGADALFAIMMEAGTIDSLRKGDYSDAAVQQAFALLGLAGLGKSAQAQIVKTAASRQRARQTQEIKSDIGLAVATSKPAIAKVVASDAPLEQRVETALAKAKETVAPTEATPRLDFEKIAEEVRTDVPRETLPTKPSEVEAFLLGQKSSKEVTPAKPNTARLDDEIGLLDDQIYSETNEAVRAAMTTQRDALVAQRDSLAQPLSGPFSVSFGSRSRGNRHEEFGTIEEAVAFARKEDKRSSNDFVELYDKDQNEVDWTKLIGKETKPPIATTTKPEAVSSASADIIAEIEKLKAENDKLSAKAKTVAPKTFLAEVNRLNNNPVRAKAPELVREPEFNSYSKQVRSAAERNYPDVLSDIDAAVALYDVGKSGEAMVKLELAVERMHAESTRLVELGAKKAGIELPKKAETLEDLLIKDDARSEMKAWAEGVRSAQDQLKRGESAQTMESNVAGKEIEEAATKRANAIRSLGVKEGSPLAKFPETPAVLAAAIEKGSGKLFDRIAKAFDDVSRQERGEPIRETLNRMTDSQKREFFGSDYINIVGGEGRPLLARTEQEAATMAAAGRRPELLKEGKAFDETRLVESELFSGRGGKQKTLGEEEVSFDFGANVTEAMNDTVLTRLDTFEANQKQALKDLMGGGTKDVVAFTAEAIARMVAIGAAKLAKGAIKFSAWSAEMVKDFGEDVRPHLASIWTESTKRMEPLRGLSVRELKRLPASILETLAETGELDSVSKLVISLERASTARSVLERAYTEERAARAEKLDVVMAKQGGQGGHFEALGKLKGEMAADKKRFEPLKLNQADIDALFRQIQAHPEMSVFDKISTGDGLMMLLNGRVPPKSRIELLDVVFGPELAQVVKDKLPLADRFQNALQQGVDLTKSALASFDMSAPFRQAAPFTLNVSKTPYTARAFGQMFRQVFSQKKFEAWLDAAKDDPMYPLMEDTGLHIADPRKGDVLGREEKYPSSIAENLHELPIIKNTPILREAAWLYSAGIKASGRAYSGFLNKLRFDVYKNIAADMIKEGLDPDVNIKDFESLASFVNNATGRGEMGKYGEPIAPFLNSVFFSPRLIAARFHMLNPHWYFKQAAPVRREAVKTMAGFIGTGMTILALAKASGASVETDPRSSDFRKIRIGNSRWDIWGGYQQWVRSFSQLLSGYRKTAKGDIHKLSPTEFPFETRKDVAERFFVAKLAPLPQLVYELLFGQKLFGDPLTAEGELYENAVPFYLQDMKEAIIEMGPSAILTVGVPGYFGVGTQTYRERPPTGAIHSQIASHLSEPATDVLMKNQVSVGRVERLTKTESAEVLRLRTELTGKLISQYVGDTVADLGTDAEDNKRILRQTVRKARADANNISKAATAEETEAKVLEYLKQEIGVIDAYEKR